MKPLLVLALLIPTAAAAETKNYNWKCVGGPLSVTTEIDRSKGYEAWGNTITIKVPNDQPQKLTKNSATEDSYANAKYEFYSFKKFTGVTKIGSKQKFLDACR